MRETKREKFLALLPDRPRFSKIREWEIKEAFPCVTAPFKVSTEVSDPVTMADRPGLIFQIVTHTTSKYCRECRCHHKVTKDAVRISANVDGEFFSREFEIEEE